MPPSPGVSAPRMAGRSGGGADTAPRQLALEPPCAHLPHQFIEARWVSKPLAFAGTLRPRRPNN
jgi:hypothetical protein